MSIAQNFPEIKPSLNLDFANVKKLDPRVTFARASTARYYDGVTTAKAEENLILRSQEFNNSWTIEATTVTANSTVAPDGTTTGDTIAFSDTMTTRIYQQFTGNGSPFTFSVFAKYIDKQWIAFRLTDSGGTARFAWFDIQNGVVGTTDTGMTASIVASTEGFYRCITTIATTATSNFAIINGVNGDGSTSNVGQTGSVAVWGAQVEQRSSVTAYTPTTTQPITNYIPVLQTAANNVARFDHDPVTGESLGLLVEEQRTNLVTYSEQFDNAAWVKSNVTVTANQVIAPDGTLSMDKLVLNSGSTNGSVRQSATGAPNFTNNYAIINLSTKEVTVTAGFASGVKVEDIGNEVLRISATVSEGYTGSVYAKKGEWEFLALQMFGVATVGNLYVYPVQSVAGSTGDGYSGIYIWGAQLEAGSKETTYIKTEASQVTRAVDTPTPLTAETNGTLLVQAPDGTYTTSEKIVGDSIAIPSAKKIYHYPQTLTADQIAALTS